MNSLFLNIEKKRQSDIIKLEIFCLNILKERYTYE